MTNIKTSDLVSLSETILLKYGLNKNDAAIIASHLLEEELMGKSSHGFFRLSGIVKALHGIEKFSEPYIEKQDGFSSLINGANHLGLIAAQNACTYARDKATQSGIALVGVNNYVGTTGAMGYYTRHLADDNLIGICICTSEYAVAPWGGKDAIFGTNPISVGIPTGSDPIVVDLATSARTYGELMLAVKENKRIPEGIVLDDMGMPSTDPNDANNGCILPMAEHKGYCLALAIEILSGIFIGSKAGKNAVVGSDGMLFIVFKPDIFVSLAQFLNQTDRLVEEITNSALAYGFTNIRIPGKESYQAYKANQRKTDIAINDEVLKEIYELVK